MHAQLLTISAPACVPCNTSMLLAACMRVHFHRRRHCNWRCTYSPEACVRGSIATFLHVWAPRALSRQGTRSAHILVLLLLLLQKCTTCTPQRWANERSRGCQLQCKAKTASDAMELLRPALEGRGHTQMEPPRQPTTRMRQLNCELALCCMHTWRQWLTDGKRNRIEPKPLLLPRNQRPQ